MEREGGREIEEGREMEHFLHTCLAYLWCEGQHDTGVNTVQLTCANHPHCIWWSGGGREGEGEEEEEEEEDEDTVHTRDAGTNLPDNFIFLFTPEGDGNETLYVSDIL